MSSALRRSARARTSYDRAENANADEFALFELMAVPDYRDVLLLELDTALLHQFRVSRAMRRWIDPILAARGVTEADVVAGIQVLVLRLLVLLENRVVRLARGEYEIEGDVNDVAHNLTTGYDRAWNPTWREGYGPLEIVAGVIIAGQAGVVLSGDWARLQVRTGGVSFDSIHFPDGVFIERDGSATMTKFTADGFRTDHNATFVMEDCYASGRGFGLVCYGDVTATRCTFENNAEGGVHVPPAQASAKLVACVTRKNGDDGLYVRQGKVMLRGCTISDNKANGVAARGGGKVTVVKAEEDKPQTVSKDNGERDWCTGARAPRSSASRRRRSTSEPALAALNSIIRLPSSPRHRARSALQKCPAKPAKGTSIGGR